MYNLPFLHATVAFGLASMLAVPTPAAAQIKVIMSGGFSAAYRAALPDFERTSGVTVTTTTGASQGSGPNTIGAQLRRGVAADVVIMAKEGLADLIAEKRIVAGSDIDLARTPVGVAVRAGAPKPDISTVDAFKQRLLEAKSVGFVGSTVGIYLTTTLFPKLGIAQNIAAKTNIGGAAAVARGEADLTIQPVSEIIHAPGVDYVGPIPADIQYISVFTAAVVEGTSQADAARRLIAFFASDAAAPAIRNSGMEPVRR
jgi:molybdate transport system substrate-binding protein